MKNARMNIPYTLLNLKFASKIVTLQKKDH